MNHIEPFLPQRRPEEAETLGDERGGVHDGGVPTAALRASYELRAMARPLSSDHEAILNSDEGWGLNAEPRKVRGGVWYLWLPIAALGLGYWLIRWALARRAPKRAFVYRHQGQAVSAVTGGPPEDMNGM